MPNITADIEELRTTETALAAQLRDLNNRARTITGRASAAGRDLTTDEAGRVDSLMAQFNAAEGELKLVRAELEAAEAEAIASTPQPRLTGPNAIAGNRPTVRPVGGIGTGRQAVMALFTGSGNGGFADLGDFARAVAQRDPRLFSNQATPAGMQSGVGVDGGFAIPPAQLAQLMTAALEDEVMRPRCQFVPMPSGTVTLPRFNDRDRSTGHAGMSGKATAEGATGVSQKAALERVSLTAKKQMVLVPTTSELLEDSGPIFGTLLAQHMGRALAAKCDDILLMGTGAGEALGLVNAPCTVEVAKESGQAAATILPRNLAKMVARLAPGSFGRSVWLAHSSVVAQLFVLVEKIANAAANDWVGGISPGWFTVSPDGSMTLMGRPMVITDRLPALGTTGDIVLADLSQYLCGQVGEARLAVDTSYGFAEDEVWFRLTLRIDGQPVLASAITPRLGTDTLSPFVRLQTRG